MNRGSFFKKLFQGAAVVSVAPSILSEVCIVETKAASKYIGGYTVMTKEMMNNMPFLQSQLPRMLMRDYMRKENQLWQEAISKDII